MLGLRPQARACRSTTPGSLTTIGWQASRTAGSSAALRLISGPMPAGSPVAMAIFALLLITSARRSFVSTAAGAEASHYCHGISDAWITSGTPWPPTDLMARSTSFRPNVWVVTFSSGKRFEASCCQRELAGLDSCGRARS